MSFISGKFGQFAYFNSQLGRPVWRGKKVLDFGGNQGNLLSDPDSTIGHEHYWCLDVSPSAIEAGRAAFPAAHWLFYNRYNLQFNPAGIVGLDVPDTGQQFDYILAYSVFTHVGRVEMRELVCGLRRQLAADGVLALTFIDPHYVPWPESSPRTNLAWRLAWAQEDHPAVRIATEALLGKARHARSCVLTIGAELTLDCDGLTERESPGGLECHTFYTVELMREMFPGAVILPPVNDEMQHCCLIRRDAGGHANFGE
ncbi:MAG TPA: class I SAM-dependent methyltransferase [Pyrinomonadaceae bacterium]|jgi:SAM-dependent methyltransferase